MKKTNYFLLIFSIASIAHAKAQTISMSADSVSILLCRQWERNYLLLGKQKISTGPGEANVFTDFKPDHTYLLCDNNGGDTTKGTWSYDPVKKLILLMIRGKHDIITSLKDGEYIQRIETAKGTQDINIVYKARTAH